MSSVSKENFAGVLVRWFHENGRPLPWRIDHDPYHVWISEIMLQQTRIETVTDYYRRFIETFPRVEDLAEASEDDVLKLWEGLGYYSRARNLHKAAREIAERGGFPDTYEEIRKLPGIGDYTAGAIGAIAFDLPVTAVDGNVMRVVSRLHLLEEDVLKESAKKHVRQLLDQMYPLDKAEGIRVNSCFVQGLMELGETICLPVRPRCESCPLKESCMAFMKGRQEELPVRIPKTKHREEEVFVLLLQDKKGRQWMARRAEKDVLAGLYEYPSAASLEEIKAKYGFDPAKWTGWDIHFLGKAKHVFTHITWQMQVYGALVEDLDQITSALGEPRLTDEVMMPTAFKKISGLVKQVLGE